MSPSSLFRRGALIIGAAALVVTLGACSPGAASDDSNSQGPVSLTVGAVFTTAAVPLWIAQEQGMFDKQGLNVTITQSPNFAASAPSLLNGQMQFANAATAPVITAIDKGMPLQILAGVSAEPDDPTIGDDQVMVPRGSTITRPRDLEGKTVAVSAVGSGPYVGVMANYLADGGKPGGINWAVMNLNEQVPALESKQVDAAVLSEPFTATARSDGFTAAFNAYRANNLNVIPAKFTDAVLVATSDYLAKNPSVASRMRSALIEANDYAQANPDAVRALLVDKLQLTPDVAKSVNLPAFVGEVDVDGIQSMIDAMKAVGLISADHDAKTLVWQP